MKQIKKNKTFSNHQHLKTETRLPFKSQKDTKSQFQLYLIIKNKFTIPLKLQIYFTILENCLEENATLPVSYKTNHWIPDIFVKAFSTLSKIQKEHFLYQNIKYLKQQLNPQANYISQTLNSPVQCIETQALMKKIRLGVTHWVSVNFKYNALKRNIKTNHNKENYNIDLRLYLIRQSKKYPSSFTLIACSQQAKGECERFTFWFDSIVCQEIYKEVMICILNYRNQKLGESLKQNMNKSVIVQNQLTRVSANERAIKFITSNNLKKYLTHRHQALSIVNNSQNQFVMIHQTQQIRIETSTKISKFFKLVSHVKMSQTQLKKEFLQSINTKYIFLSYLEVLEEYSKKYKVTYQRYIIGNHAHEMILTKQENHTDSTSDIIFVKGIQNIVTSCFLNFMSVKALELRKNESKLIIYAKFNVNEEDVMFSTEIIIEYLMQFHRMLFRSQRKDQLNQFLMSNYGEYFTIRGSSLEEEVAAQQQLLQKLPKLSINRNAIQDSSQDKESKKGQISNLPQRKKSNSNIQKQNIYLTHHFQLIPTQKKSPQLIAQHFFFNEWKRKEKGGLVCINQKILDEQSKVIKHIVKSIGKKLIGSSDANISLPVGIFKKESHLSTISRNNSYAPLLLENVVNKSPLQKMKTATIFNIAVNILGISIGKPFNPILGETFQAWIDGCPIYMEQISHHPPIGYYLFYGRGYQLHGGILPQAQIGFNNIKASSSFPSYLTFDDGVNIYMQFGKMLLKGFIYGDREFTYVEKALLFDEKNRLFSQIRFGPRQTGLFESSYDPEDYVCGNIYQVTEEFAEEFQKQTTKKYPNKKHIVKILSSFEGIWSQAISIDGKEVINFAVDLPCEMVDEKFPLPSNSSYRQDLAKFIQGDYDQAQRMKDQLENLQRNDRKLRQTKSNHKSH